MIATAIERRPLAEMLREWLQSLLPCQWVSVSSRQLSLVLVFDVAQIIST
jgi:hypothetical protein